MLPRSYFLYPYIPCSPQVGEVFYCFASYELGYELVLWEQKEAF